MSFKGEDIQSGSTNWNENSLGSEGKRFKEYVYKDQLGHYIIFEHINIYIQKDKKELIIISNATSNFQIMEHDNEKKEYKCIYNKYLFPDTPREKTIPIISRDIRVYFNPMNTLEFWFNGKIMDCHTINGECLFEFRLK